MKRKKMRLSRISLVVILIAMFFPWNVYAEDNIEMIETAEIIKQVIIVKDELGLFVKDTVFEIQNNSGEVLEICVGDENGRAEINKVEDGTYWLIQKQTQEGYQLIEDKIIEIKIEDPIKEEVIINQKIDEEKKLEKDETEKDDESFDLVPEETVENEENISNDPIFVEEKIPISSFNANEITVKITQSSEDSTKFKISTKGYAGKAGISKVMFPTWSNKNGQDDLHWYSGCLDSNGEYTAEIDIKDHGFETGEYNIHTYIFGLNGEILKVYPKVYQQEATNPEMTVGEINNNKYCVQVTGVSNDQGVTGMVFPTWSNKNGQDDIKWVSGRYIGKDTWEAEIDLRDYHESYDTFVTHGYCITKNNEFKYIDAIQKTVENPFIKSPLEINITNGNDQSQFKIETVNCYEKIGIEGISFPVWTNRNGQDEITWYTGKHGNNGEYSAIVDIEDHNFETGNYVIHTYVFGRKDEIINVKAFSYNMKKPIPRIEYDKAVLNNIFKIRIKNLGNENGIKGVVFPTWSNKNGQDDIQWEKGTYIGNHTWEATINLRNYYGIVDDFISHAYSIDSNGKMIMTLAACKTITQNTSTVYGDLLYPLDKIYKPNPNDPTDWFGPRWGRIHEGIDVPAPYYAKCYSPGDGIIEKAGYFMGYGRYVRIRMTDRYGESVSFFYGHLQEVNVCVGQTVTKGQLVGKVGGSGYNAQGRYVDDAYGPHLHFGAIANADFVCVDPEIWIDFHNPYNNLK